MAIFFFLKRFFNLKYLTLHMSVLPASVYVCAPRVGLPLVTVRSGVSDPLELGSLAVGNHVNAGNQTWVPYKSSHGS